MKRIRFVHVAFAALVAALAVPAAGVSKGNAVPTAVGKGEGALTLVAWEGYTDKLWVAPFEKQTGCKVTAKYAGSSNDMFNLMTSGGGGQYDMVSASGDASLRLIYAGAVAEVNVKLIPAYKDFFKAFQSPANNTVDGKHYGVSLQFGPNVLLYDTKAFPKKPTSWAAIYARRTRARSPSPTTRSRSPTRRSTSRRRSRPRDQGPLRADEGAARRGRRLLKSSARLSRSTGRSRPTRSTCSRTAARRSAPRGRTSSQLLAAKAKVATVIPKEGATGWLDTWMLSSKAKHPNCAYKWMQYISQPKGRRSRACPG